VFLTASVKRRPDLSATARSFLLAGLASVLFTLRQCEALIWSCGFSMQVVLLLAVLFGEAFPAAVVEGKRVAYLAILLIAAPHSLLNGAALSMTVLGMGALALVRRQPLPRGFRWLALLAVAATVVSIATYRQPSYHPDLRVALQHPLAAIDYCMLWIGGPFSARPTLARWYGAGERQDNGAGHRRALVAYRERALAHPLDFSRCDPSGVYPGGQHVHERTAILRDHQLSFFRLRP
jgi:hypothetical protein